MSIALIEKLNQKRNLEAKWASEFLANGAVTVDMVNISREVKKLEQELKDDSDTTKT
jgi:hypothetical protein